MAEKTLLEKIFEIQKVCDYFQKDAKNYQYKSVSGEQVFTKVRSKMDELGLLLETHLSGEVNIKSTSQTIQSTKPSYEGGRKVEVPIEKIVDCREYTQTGFMVWVDVKTGNERKIPWIFAGEHDDISKAVGGALTYCERYFIMKYFKVPTSEDDPDNRVKSGYPAEMTNKVVETEIPAGTLMTSTAKMLFGEVKGLEVRLVTDKGQIKSQLAWANKKDKVKFSKFIQAAEARILELDKGINQTHKTIIPKQPPAGMPEESNIDDINAEMDRAYMEKVNGNDVSVLVERLD